MVTVLPVVDGKPTDTGSVGPASATGPAADSKSYPLPTVVPFRSTAKVEPALNVTLPLWRMPGPPTPGLTMPLTVTGPVVPVPPRVAPLATVTLLEDWLSPLTSSVPALTVVGP